MDTDFQFSEAAGLVLSAYGLRRREDTPRLNYTTSCKTRCPAAAGLCATSETILELEHT